MQPAVCRRRTRPPSRQSPTTAASRSTSTARGSSTRASRSASRRRSSRRRPTRSRSACRRACLPGRLGRRRVARLHRPRPPRPEARRRRDAPGGRARRGRARRAAGRRRGMIERLADDHANARRLAEVFAELPGIVSPGDIAQPGAGPPRPGPRHDELRPVPGRPRPARLPRGAQGAERPDGRISPWPGPGGDPQRHRNERSSAPIVAAVRASPRARRAAARAGSRRRRARSDAPGRLSRDGPGDHRATRSRVGDAARGQGGIVTDRLEDVVLTRPSAPARARSTSASTTSSRRASGGSSATTRSSGRTSASTPRTTASATASRDAVLGELADEKAHLAAVEAIDAGGPLAAGPARARPRDPQPPADDLRHRGRPDLGAALDRARRRSATPCS